MNENEMMVNEVNEAETVVPAVDSNCSVSDVVDTESSGSAAIVGICVGLMTAGALAYAGGKWAVGKCKNAVGKLKEKRASKKAAEGQGAGTEKPAEQEKPSDTPASGVEVKNEEPSEEK